MFTLTTDSTIDLFKSELKKLNVPYIPLTYTIDGKIYEDHYDSDAEYEEFFAKLRDGAKPITSQITPILHEEFFKKVYNENKQDIVHIALSGGLSKTYESACLAASNLKQTNPEINVYVVDPLATTQASMPVFEKALELRDSGEDAAKAAEFLRDYTLYVQVYVVPDDLFHLHRGGRVSRASATLGTMFNVKPVIVFNNLGELKVYKKAIGFNRALKIIMEHIEKYQPEGGVKKIWLADACAHTQTAAAKKALQDKFNCEIQTGWIGPVIGAHTGSGTLGIVYVGKGKDRIDIREKE